MKKIVIFFILFTSIYADITIENAWQKVLHVNEGLKASQAEVNEANQLKNATKSMYFPEISVSGSYTKLEKDLAIEDEIEVKALGTTLPLHLPLQDKDVFLSQLSLLWPLYTGGRIEAAADAYTAKEEEAKAKMRMEKDKTFLKLIKVYYGVVMSDALLKTRQEAQNALNHHYENAKKLKEQGQIALIELLNAQVKLDAAKIQTTKAQYSYEITKLALKDMLDADELPASTMFIESNLEDEKEYNKDMLTSYAGLAVIKSKQDQVNSHITIEKAAFLPTFFAFGNYLLYKDNSPLMEMTPNWTAGIGVKYTIVSREGRSEKIAAAKMLKNRLVHTLKQAQKDLGLLVEKTYMEMLQYKQEYEDLSSSLKMAKENLRLRELAFKEGLATSVEVVDAQMFLTGAKTNRLNAIYNYVQKISQLAVLSGNSETFFALEKNSLGIKINE